MLVKGTLDNSFIVVDASTIPKFFSKCYDDDVGI